MKFIYELTSLTLKTKKNGWKQIPSMSKAKSSDTADNFMFAARIKHQKAENIDALKLRYEMQKIRESY